MSRDSATRARSRIAPALVLALAAAATTADARVVHVAARDTLARAVLAAALPGDTVSLDRGVHRGPLRVTVPLVLRGAPGAVVDGLGQGSVIAVGAAGTRIEDLEVRGSGHEVLTIDAGI